MKVMHLWLCLLGFITIVILSHPGCASDVFCVHCAAQDPRDLVSGEKQVADDMLDFLQEFFEGVAAWCSTCLVTVSCCVQRSGCPASLQHVCWIADTVLLEVSISQPRTLLAYTLS
jgi:hypothetical protein